MISEWQEVSGNLGREVHELANLQFPFWEAALPR